MENGHLDLFQVPTQVANYFSLVLGHMGFAQVRQRPLYRFSPLPAAIIPLQTEMIYY